MKKTKMSWCPSLYTEITAWLSINEASLSRMQTRLHPQNTWQQFSVRYLRNMIQRHELVVTPWWTPVTPQWSKIGQGARLWWEAPCKFPSVHHFHVLLHLTVPNHRTMSIHTPLHLKLKRCNLPPWLLLIYSVLVILVGDCCALIGILKIVLFRALFWEGHGWGISQVS